MIISIDYTPVSYRKHFWGIVKYRIAGYENRYWIESWQTIRFTSLANSVFIILKDRRIGDLENGRQMEIL